MKAINIVNNWFATQVQFRNTVKAWLGTYNVTRTIAQHIQDIAAKGATQKQVESVVVAHQELTTQIGF